MNKIPAKVSETEIIIPPGVVSYYGVKFFEDLRGQAKQDFARMEAEGRVGGEPVDSNGVPMEQDEELTPEEMAMLQEALGQAPTGMYQGGMVPQQQRAMYNPYEQQQTQYSQPMFQSSRSTGMAVGGAVQAVTGTTGGATAAIGASGTKTYINKATGQQMTLPAGAVPPAGFEEVTDDMSTPSPLEMTQPRGPEMGGDGSDEGPGDTGTRKSAEEMAAMSPSDFKGMVESHNAAVTGPMGTVVGMTPGLNVLGSKINQDFKAQVEEAQTMNPELPDLEVADLSMGVKGALGAAAKSAISETKEAMSQAEEAAAETAEDAEGVGEGSEGGEAEGGQADGGEGGDRGDNDEGGGSEQGFALGGVAKKKPAKKKKSKKYGLGTRP